MRDIFINGLQSDSIRKRLLQRTSVDFQTAKNIVRSLKAAQKQSQSHATENVSCSITLMNRVPAPRSASSSNEAEPTVAFVRKGNCYFCDHFNHARSKCHAKSLWENRSL